MSKKKKIIELIKNIIYREKLKSDNNALKKNKRYVCWIFDLLMAASFKLDLSLDNDTVGVEFRIYP